MSLALPVRLTAVAQVSASQQLESSGCWCGNQGGSQSRQLKKIVWVLPRAKESNFGLLVLADTSTDQVRNGMAELVKIAVVSNC